MFDGIDTAFYTVDGKVYNRLCDAIADAIDLIIPDKNDKIYRYYIWNDMTCYSYQGFYKLVESIYYHDYIKTIFNLTKQEEIIINKIKEIKVTEKLLS